MLLAAILFLINRRQPHDTRQAPHEMATAFVALPLHIFGPSGVTRTWRFKELLIDDLYEPQVLSTFALRLVVQIGPRQCQQATLTPDSQLVISAHHCLPRVPSNRTEASAKKILLHHKLPDLRMQLLNIRRAHLFRR